MSKYLMKLEDMIRPILMVNEAARSSDKELSLLVWNIYFGVCPWTPLNEVLRNDKIPSIESIGRIRRKLQEKDEALRPVDDTIRIEAQKDFIEYALSDR